MTTSSCARWIVMSALTASMGCSRSEPSPPVKPKVPVLPDLAQSQTWDRADSPLRVKGRAKVVLTSREPQLEYLCQEDPSCLCVGQAVLAIQGPREGDVAELHTPPNPEGTSGIYTCSDCSGECPLPLGEAELEGTLHDHTFVLTKLPIYLDGRAPEPTSGLAPAEPGTRARFQSFSDRSKIRSYR